MTVEAILSAVLSPEVANAASLISLALTVGVLRNLYALRMHFLFTARLPQLIEDLSQNIAAFAQGLAQEEEWADVVDMEMERCRANLRSLIPKIDGATCKSAKSILKNIEAYLLADRAKPLARRIHTSLVGLIQELRNLHEDTKWSE